MKEPIDLKKRNHFFPVVGAIALFLAIPLTVYTSLISRPLDSKAVVISIAGGIKIWKNADSGFDVYTANTTKHSIINSRYQGMLVYESHSDSYLTWYNGKALFYKDAYAIYTDYARNKDNASVNWILRDANGNPCYIPWGNPPYDQYVADIGNQTFRTNWINYAVNKLNSFPGYAGMFVDDVNLDNPDNTGISRVTCGSAIPSGNNNLPIDPRTGAAMTGSNWDKYMAEFMEAIRASTPNKLIAHNTIWYISPFTNQYLLREIQAADIIEMEQGFHDGGLTGGTGKYSWLRKMDFVNLVHANGAVVIDRDEGVSTDSQQEYGVANYLLLNNGDDYYDPVYKSSPNDSWGVYGADLGAAAGNRYLWSGVWRRDFSGGVVLVNPPGSSAITVNLGGSHTDLYGNQFTSVTLNAKQGKVLRVQINNPGGTTHIIGSGGSSGDKTSAGQSTTGQSSTGSQVSGSGATKSATRLASQSAVKKTQAANFYQKAAVAFSVAVFLIVIGIASFYYLRWKKQKKNINDSQSPKSKL